MPEGRFLTVPNLLSLSRVPLTGAAAFWMLRGNMIPAGVFMVLAVATDALDGFVARRTGTETDWGRILDPLADKVSIALFAVALVVRGVLAPWILGFLAGRDLLIGVGGLLLGRGTRPPSARPLGKASTLLVSMYLLRQALVPEWALPSLVPGLDSLGTSALVMAGLSLLDYVAVFTRGIGGESHPCN